MSRKHGFFDITYQTDEIEIQENTQTVSSECEVSQPTAKKQFIIMAVIAALLLTSFLLIRNYFYSDEISGSLYYPEEWLTPSVRDEIPSFVFSAPNWESDILNDPEYLSLKGDIMYAPNDSLTYSVPDGAYLSEGGKGLLFMAEYINAIICGDNEALNTMYTDEYFKKNSPHSAFPEQRLYDIKITKYHYKDPQYEESYTTDAYYIVSYKIRENDGLFRNDIGQDSELPQLFKILIYPDGTVKADAVVALPGYYNN